MRLVAEVIEKFEEAGDCNALLYDPLPEPMNFRRTRRYELGFDGDEEPALDFVRKVLLDEISQELHVGEEPALEGFVFHLDYGMKPGALDLEKEAILEHHRGRRAKSEGGAGDDFILNELKINDRIYVFSPDAAVDAAGSPDRFINDIVNPAIHTWSITHAGTRCA